MKGPVNNIDFNLVRKPKTPIIFNKYNLNNYDRPIILQNNQKMKKAQSSERSRDELNNHYDNYHGPNNKLINLQNNKKSNMIFSGIKRPSTAPQKDKMLKIVRPNNYMSSSAGFNSGYMSGLLGPNKRVPSPMIISQQNFYKKNIPEKFKLLPSSIINSNNNYVTTKKKKYGF